MSTKEELESAVQGFSECFDRFIGSAMAGVSAAMVDLFHTVKDFE